ncbi:3-oxoacyl-[acyl-carrier-protein] synthase, mitochondrial-like isoform X3 [Ostrea edulis]|uniref:3-oxoacyl-[acyl-carrier-protein] synthase, mitochondrial-like isoform X3 n=1 Tax=Ostrea edulis TaxID=37623 RepID=UPI002095ED5B|nr:3-oxoacyl-[acyl-carrier-protein] synthase, mitochondrial-like isoform X3 [Ostrea edulis]
MNTRPAVLRMSFPTRLIPARRVVVTGIGLVTCLGVGKDKVWNNLIKGQCGIRKIDNEAGFVPEDVLKPFTSTEKRQLSEGMMYTLVAAEEALTDANWKPETPQEQERTGVTVGMGMNGMEEIYRTADRLFQKGYREINPFFMPKILINMAAGHVSLKYGFQGPNHSVSTACTTGLHAVGDAFRFIQRGDADVMVAGGAEESPNPLSVAGFSRMRALCTKFNNHPTEASRPFDKDRNGFVMSEGAGVLILEEMSHAIDRGASIYAEVLGYGLSGDAFHMTAPRTDGRGAYRCMLAAIKDAGISPTCIGYINAHATSTPLGDKAESQAIWRIFEQCHQKPLVSSTKGALGHLLGAAGSVEAAITVLTCQSGIVPPTLNLHQSDTGVDLDYVPLLTRDWKAEIRTALTNSFGFGGTNGTLCIRSFDKG